MTDAPKDPMSYETTVEELSPGHFEVIVTTVDEDGSHRQEVGTHITREKAELAASLVDRSAKRYVGVGDSDKNAPTYANPEKP